MGVSGERRKNEEREVGSVYIGGALDVAEEHQTARVGRFERETRDSD